MKIKKINNGANGRNQGIKFNWDDRNDQLETKIAKVPSPHLLHVWSKYYVKSTPI